MAAGIQCASAAEKKQEKTRLAFGEFVFDLDSHALLRRGAPVPMRRQVAQLLALLLASPGELVSRDAITDELWPQRIVESDQAINSLMRQLRCALGDDSSNPQFIATEPRRGYMFVASVEMAGSAVRSRANRRRLAAAAVMLMSFLGFLGLRSDQATDGSEPRDDVRIAIMQIIPLQDDTPAKHLAAGLTDDLIYELSRGAENDSRIVSIRNFGEASRDAVSEADYILTGSLLLDDNKVRWQVNLVNGATGDIVWARRYECPMAGMVALRHALAGRVTAALGETI